MITAQGGRGMLCFNCNGALGQFRDRADLMPRAVGYVRGRRVGHADRRTASVSMCCPSMICPPADRRSA
jgi:Recombination endonuclease VII